MMTANVANRATNSLSSAQLGVEGKNPLRSLAKAAGALLRAELVSSASYLGQTVRIAAKNFFALENTARSKAVRALHAAA